MNSENSMNDDVRDSDSFDVDSELDEVVAAEVAAVYAELDSDGASDEFDDEFDDDLHEDDIDDLDDIDDAPEVATESTAPTSVHLSSLPVTGEARVDDALARLGDLNGMPVGEHVAVYEDVQRRLHDTLADLAGQ